MRTLEGRGRKGSCTHGYKGKAKVHASLLGAQRERSLTNRTGNVREESWWNSLDLEGCTCDHRGEGKHFKI